MNQDITFLTDDGETVRNMAVTMSPCAEHVLDWFHITMRLTVLGQYAKGLAHHNPQEAEDDARELRRIKGYLRSGNHRQALPCIEWLVDDLDAVETDYPGMKAFRESCGWSPSRFTSDWVRSPTRAVSTRGALSSSEASWSINSSTHRARRCKLQSWRDRAMSP